MNRPPMKLLDKVRVRIRLKGYSIRTEKSYVSWIRRFIVFHNERHPTELGKAEIEAFLSHLLMAKLMYGSGLRVIKCVRLRIKDIDFQMNQTVVRDGSPLR